MSMVLTRSPLEPIGMNGGSGPKRRSARLSAEGAEENEPPTKKGKTIVVGTKEQDGDSAAATKKKRKVYDEEVDDFAFTRSKKSKASKAPAVRNSTAERTSPAKAAPVPPTEPIRVPVEDPTPKTVQRKAKRKLPDTPERDAVKRTVRRSGRLSSDNVPVAQQPSPIKPAHAKSHENHNRSPSPLNARPVTVEKKRRKGPDGVEEEKTMRIQLPFADTPVIRRNKEMRKTSAENGHRRSSSGMRGRRASSLIEEKRGSGESGVVPSKDTLAPPNLTPLHAEASEHAVAALSQSQWPAEADTPSPGLSTPPPSEGLEALLQECSAMDVQTKTSADALDPNSALPHPEVPATDFFKHISADITEPQRMRCLLGWCGTRALPSKPEAPKDSSSAAGLEFQVLQAARVIQEELSQDLVSNASLSYWFGRESSPSPRIPLRKKPNPRNEANLAKADELERELDRLKKERAEWDQLISSAVSATSPTQTDEDTSGQLSPLHPELLDSPQRAILEQLQARTTESSTDPKAIQQRLRNISDSLEFTVDQLAHGMHALSTTKDTAERLADRSLNGAAGVLQGREKRNRLNGVDTMDALKGLARVLNAQRR